MVHLLTLYTSEPTKAYAINVPAGPELCEAPPDPINRPVPMVPPIAFQVSMGSLRESFGTLSPIICRCLYCSFLLRWTVLTNPSCFSGSEWLAKPFSDAFSPSSPLQTQTSSRLQPPLRSLPVMERIKQSSDNHVELIVLKAKETHVLRGHRGRKRIQRLDCNQPLNCIHI